MTTTATTTPSATTPTPFGEVTTLGKPLSYHEQRVQNSQGRRKVANATMIFGVALLVFGGILMLQANGNALCLVLPGVGLLGLGLLGLWDAKNTADLRLAIFEQGIATSEKGRLQTMQWEEIDRCYQILTRRGTTDIIQHGYRLEGANGQKIWWNDDVSHAAQAWESVRRELYPRLVQRMRGALNRGESIAYGEFTVHPTGLTLGKQNLLWGEIEQVNLANGMLTIRGLQQGKKVEMRGMWATIPNGELMLDFVERLRPQG